MMVPQCHEVADEPCEEVAVACHEDLAHSEAPHVEAAAHSEEAVVHSEGGVDHSAETDLVVADPQGAHKQTFLLTKQC